MPGDSDETLSICVSMLIEWHKYARSTKHSLYYMYLTHYRNLSQDVLKLLSLLFFVEIVEGKYQGSFTRVLKVIWDDINSINQSINQSKNKHDRNWTHDRFRFRPGIIIIGHVTPNQTHRWGWCWWWCWLSLMIINSVVLFYFKIKTKLPNMCFFSNLSVRMPSRKCSCPS